MLQRWPTTRGALIALWLWTAGCGLITSAFDTTVRTLESVLVPFRSSSQSLGSAHAGREDYQRDVRSFAIAFLTTGGTSEDFARGVGKIAERHGITHWEAVPETLVAVGEGLRETGVPEREVRDSLARDDPQMARLILSAFEGAPAPPPLPR